MTSKVVLNYGFSTIIQIPFEGLEAKCLFYLCIDLKIM